MVVDLEAGARAAEGQVDEAPHPLPPPHGRQLELLYSTSAAKQVTAASISPRRTAVRNCSTTWVGSAHRGLSLEKAIENDATVGIDTASSLCGPTPIGLVPTAVQQPSLPTLTR